MGNKAEEAAAGGRMGGGQEAGAAEAAGADGGRWTDRRSRDEE